MVSVGRKYSAAGRNACMPENRFQHFIGLKKKNIYQKHRIIFHTPSSVASKYATSGLRFSLAQKRSAQPSLAKQEIIQKGSAFSCPSLLSPGWLPDGTQESVQPSRDYPAAASPVSLNRFDRNIHTHPSCYRPTSNAFGRPPNQSHPGRVLLLSSCPSRNHNKIQAKMWHFSIALGGRARFLQQRSQVCESVYHAHPRPAWTEQTTCTSRGSISLS